MGTDQDKEALHQAHRLQAHLALDTAFSAASQYGITNGRGLYKLQAHARWLSRR